MIFMHLNWENTWYNINSNLLKLKVWICEQTHNFEFNSTKQHHAYKYDKVQVFEIFMFSYM